MIWPLESILGERRSTYSTANSGRLDGMSEAEIEGYRLLICPGGNVEQIGKALTPDATARLQSCQQLYELLGHLRRGFLRRDLSLQRAPPHVWHTTPVLFCGSRPSRSPTSNFMCAVLGIEPATNDGDPAVTRDMPR